MVWEQIWYFSCYNLLRCVLAPECGPSWWCWMFHVSLGRMCILLLLGEVCRCQSYLGDRWCSVQLCSLLIFCLLGLSFADRGLSESPALTVGSSISPCNLITFCLTVWCPVVRYIYVTNCHVFLGNWPLYHYVLPLFIHDNFPCFEVCSVWN